MPNVFYETPFLHRVTCMSWLKLTASNLYLMKGGSDKYIDRVRLITQPLGASNTLEGYINEFPHEWFLDEAQRPKTIIVNTLEERNGAPTLNPCTSSILLRRFETPVSYKLYEELSKSKDISDLILKFENSIGYRFTDEFSTFYLDGRPLKIISRIKSQGNIEIKKFPVNPINPNDLDFDQEEPSFISILLELIWDAGYTIKPYLLNNPNFDDKISVELLVSEPQSPVGPQRVSAETLEKAALPIKFIRKEENQKLFQVLKQLSDERGISVNCSNDISNQYLDNIFEGQLTFTAVMDIISSAQGALWDWQGIDTALISRS